MFNNATVCGRRLTVWILVCLLIGVTPVLAEKSPQATHGVIQPEAILEATDDRELSPITGYTRDHWLEMCEKLIAGVLQYYDESTGVPMLPGTPGETAHFEEVLRGDYYKEEVFDRTLMLVVSYVAATGRDRVPGYSGSITKPYLDGIIRYSDPEHPGYFEHTGHAIFGTNIAKAALIAPEFFWDPLNSKQRNNLLDFMENLAYTPGWDCNHWYFHLMAVPLLQREGREVDQEFFDMLFRRLLDWYRGDGWFIDGGNLTFDYYNLWGFQLYNHALIKFSSRWEEMFGQEVAQINKHFQDSFIYMFGRDGGQIPWGRSLSYRFASLSALGWSLMAGTNALPPGQARRIASGCMKYFWEHGAMSANGTLEPGWWGPNSSIGEEYQQRGAPYWAAHGFAPLMLPADHPFWTDQEQPIPADGPGGSKALPGAQMTLKVSPIDGDARNYIAGEPVGHVGQWQRGIKYFQHAYSSYLGWCALGENGPDLGQGRTGVSLDGENWTYRTNPRPIHVGHDRIISEWDFMLSELDARFEHFGTLTTHTLIGDEGEVHVFWHNSATPLHLWLGGYGISVNNPESVTVLRDDGSLAIDSDRYKSYLKILTGPEGGLDHTVLQPLPGYNHAHLFGGWGTFPHWISSMPVGPMEPVVVYVHGARDREPVIGKMTTRRLGETLEVEFEGRNWSIKLPY